MSTADLLRAYLDSLAANGYCQELIGDLEAHCVNAEIGMRKARERDIRDMQIAELIPLGPAAVIERFGGAKRTAFWRAARGRKLLKGVQQKA